MESTNSTTDQQTPPPIPMNNSSSRRKQSKPNRLEHAGLTGDPLNSLPSITQYHVAAEQQDLGIADEECDRISLNCEDGSSSSHSTGEHSNGDNQITRTKSTNETLPDNQIGTISNALDFSYKLDNDTNNEQLFNRSRSSNKSRSLKRKHANGETPAISMPTRVFHADAFCGICRKEFCNKYFLKTHLANKHGIFDHQSVVPSPTDPTSNGSLQHPFTILSTLINDNQEQVSSPSPSSDILQNPDEHQMELGSLRQQMNGVITGDDEDEDEDEQDGMTTNSLLNLPQQIASILGNDQTNINPMKTDDDQRVITTNSPDFQSQQLSSTTATNSSRQSSAKLPEDFCDICQKHFCNKYYLRKHKLDVHGVQTDCNIKSYKRIDNNNSSSKNSPTTPQITSAIQLPSSFPNVTFNPSSVQQSLGMLLNPIFSPLVQSPSTSNDQPNLKRRYTDSSNESSSSKSAYLTSDVVNVFAKSSISTCHLCGKKFQSNDYLQLHLMNKHQIKIDTQQRTTKLSNSNTIKKIKLEPHETTIIKASSPIETTSSPNPSTGIPGIVDTYFAAKMADRVSCDICHKQVCNKYFLKTHKLKVHGVGPDSTVTPSETNEDESDQQQQTIDHSPPQLIVDEINTEPGAIPSPDALTASVNTFMNTNNDSNEACDVCSKTFPSKFLLHIHMTNVHGISQSTSITANGTGIKRPLSNGTNNSPVRLKQTPQVQLRVTCQVCKKELCNKYFLRAHMRNVHNMTVDELRQASNSISPSPSNSDKQVFSLSSNLLSPTSTTIPTASDLHSRKRLLSHNENGHLTDSNESEHVSSSNDKNNNNHQLLSMQPFLVESDDDLYKDLFVPCMVYLPCRHRVTKPLEISLRLKPVDNTNTSTTTTD